MAILESQSENQMFLDDEYFVKFHICFIGIKSKYLHGQHLKCLTRFCKFLWLCALKYTERKKSTHENTVIPCPLDIEKGLPQINFQAWKSPGKEKIEKVLEESWNFFEIRTERFSRRDDDH